MMKVTEIDLERLQEAPWNPNKMDSKTLARLKKSLSRYGLVGPLVVRPDGDSNYEVLSGNQRLKVIEELGFKQVPCVIVQLNDTEAKLLAQALNTLRGEDDLGLKGKLLREILSKIPEGEVLSLLPETAESLRALSSFTQEDLAEHLQAWQEAQAARLRHVQLQFTDHQLEVVEEALSRALPKAKDLEESNPNHRSTAAYLLCKYYLENAEEK